MIDICPIEISVDVFAVRSHSLIRFVECARKVTIYGLCPSADGLAFCQIIHIAAGEDALHLLVGFFAPAKVAIGIGVFPHLLYGLAIGIQHCLPLNRQILCPFAFCRPHLLPRSAGRFARIGFGNEFLQPVTCFAHDDKFLQGRIYPVSTQAG